MQLSDIRQGRTIYLVSAFPHDQEFNRNNSSIRTLLIMSRPFKTLLAGKTSWKFKVLNYANQWNPHGEEFCSTWNISDKNTYNNHRAFFSLKAAQRYQQRMLNGCLSQEETELTAIVAAKREHMRRFDMLCPPLDFCPEPPEYGTSLSRMFFPFQVRKENSVVVIGNIV